MKSKKVWEKAAIFSANVKKSIIDVSVDGSQVNFKADCVASLKGYLYKSKQKKGSYWILVQI